MGEDFPRVSGNVPQKKLMDDVDPRAPTLLSPPIDPKKKRRVWATVKKWAIRLAVTGVVLLIAAGIGGYLLIRHYEEGLPSIAELSQGYRPSQVTRVVARDGTTLAEIFNERRTIIKIEDLPRHVKLAVLAAEDASFYEHEGINWLGIARAAVVNLRAGRTRQGGSTITQQVVKNILLETQERTYSRKMKEALLARRLEQELCPECGSDQAGKDRRKDKILELYLNHIYFGHGRYGVEEAARSYFGKSVRDVTLAEAATLAAIVKGPRLYSPRIDANRSIERRAFVLDQMVRKGFAPVDQAEAAKKAQLVLAPESGPSAELAPEGSD